jgi:CspA family cold shock protein
MQRGIVRWYNTNKGFGFISPENGSTDVYISAAILKEANVQVLKAGDSVSYNLLQNQDRTSASHIKLNQSW